LFYTNADKRIISKEILAHVWLQGVPLPPPVIVKNPVTAFQNAAKMLEKQNNHEKEE
jgi:hypothetical protein